MRASIKDIAKITGYSITTVSLVLNDKGEKFPAETKAKIQEAARSLNYRPNRHAVSLVKQHSKTFGLIVPDISNHYFAQLATGIERGCREYGRMMFLCNTNDQHERNIEYINQLAEMGVDGIFDILSGDTTQEQGIREIQLMNDLEIPHILVDRFLDVPGCGGIRNDHARGGYLATKHLIDLGHREIACVTGPQLLRDARQRYEGYCKALIESGIDPESQCIFRGDYTVESGEAAVELWPKGSYSAVFACNDASAMGVCRALMTRGISIPEDVSVVGYDDAIYAQMLQVPLTTIQQPVQQMGMAAAKCLVDMVREHTALPEPIVFEPELIVRSSSARRSNL